MRLMLIASSGRHINELFCLRRFWEVKDRFWVGFPIADAKFLLKDEAVTKVNRDPVHAGRVLIDPELKMFHELNMQAVLLQNLTTDLMLGARVLAPFQVLAQCIEKGFQAMAESLTYNMPLCANDLQQEGIKDPSVYSEINKVGYQMQPGVAACENALAENEPPPMAAGVVLPQKSLECRTASADAIGDVRCVLHGQQSHEGQDPLSALGHTKI